MHAETKVEPGDRAKKFIHLNFVCIMHTVLLLMHSAAQAAWLTAGPRSVSCFHRVFFASRGYIEILHQQHQNKNHENFNGWSK